MIKTTCIWLLLLTFCLLAAYFFVWRTTLAATDRPASAPRTIVVKSGLVEAIRAEPHLKLSGNKLMANRSVIVSPEVTGRITTIAVHSGQQVAKGSVLVRFDDTKQRAERTELMASLSDEERKLRDMRRLVGSGAITTSELEGQEAIVAQAKARADAASYELSRRTLLAPFDGTVNLIDLSEGTLVNSGDTLLHLDDLATLRLDLAVPERYLSLLQPGIGMTATSSAWPEDTFSGTVTDIDSRIAEESQNIKVRIEVDNPTGRLKPNMLL